MISQCLKIHVLSSNCQSGRSAQPKCSKYHLQCYKPTRSILGFTCLCTCVWPMEIRTLFRKSDSSRLSTAAPRPSNTVTACRCSISRSMSYSSWFSLFILTILGNRDFRSGSDSKNLKEKLLSFSFSKIARRKKKIDALTFLPNGIKFYTDKDIFVAGMRIVK